MYRPNSFDTERPKKHFARMRNFVFFFVAALPVLTGCGAFDRDENVSNEMVLATFNLRLAPTPESNTWHLRKNAVGKLVLAHKFDVFGTQEGYLHQLKDIESATGCKFTGVARDDGRSSGEYSAIFYNPKRMELLDSGNFWFSETPDKPSKGWDAACKRICSWGKFRDRLDGKEFFFFSLHFDHKGKAALKNSSKLLLSKVREIAGNSPAVCVGDYNATVLSEPMAEILSDGLLKDSKTISKTPASGPGGTFHNFTGIPKFDRIDYILLTGGFDVLSYAVLDDSAADLEASPAKGADGGAALYPSDHFPVVVRAVLK